MRLGEAGAVGETPLGPVALHQTKYVMPIEMVESFSGIGQGERDYWEDQGYVWYGGHGILAKAHYIVRRSRNGRSTSRS